MAKTLPSSTDYFNKEMLSILEKNSAKSGVKSGTKIKRGK